MPDFSRIVIAGVGLIGGSIGLAARQRGVADEVVGLVRSDASADRARAAGVADRVTTDPADAAMGADLVVIATPVSTVVETLAGLLPHLPTGTIVTDAGSTKSKIVADAERLLAESNVRFVGSHPLAGDTRTGPEAARADLLNGKTVVVTPTDATDADAVQQTSEFWERLGAVVSTMNPGAHDALVAETSHLPHLVASTLAAFTSGNSLPHAGSGWRDTTRVAAGDPDLWVDIFRDNRVNVIGSAEHFRERLDHVLDCLRNENWSMLKAILAVGKKFRDEAEKTPAKDANQPD